MTVKTFKTEAALPDADWEVMHAHYDEQTYRAVLNQLCPSDIVLDIGAGDLRLAVKMAEITRRVYAVEINAQVLELARASHDPFPANLAAVCADARELDFPSGITTGVLLMRHCTCFRLYADKLRNAGATRLITNARWRMSVEAIDLLIPRRPLSKVEMGWYACMCGGTGFKEGSVEHWSFEMDKIVHEVSSCPRCR